MPPSEVWQGAERTHLSTQTEHIPSGKAASLASRDPHCSGYSIEVSNLHSHVEQVREIHVSRTCV